MADPRGWTNLGEKSLVSTPWFQLNQAEVELPGGHRPALAAAAPGPVSG